MASGAFRATLMVAGLALGACLADPWQSVQNPDYYMPAPWQLLDSAEGEGRDAVLELAEEVKANPLEKLPIPFAIENHGDVGYLGGLPMNVTIKSVFKQLHLSTQRENENYPSWILIGRTTMPSGRPNTPPPSWRSLGPHAGGVATKHLNGAVNPTAELNLMGWQTDSFNTFSDELATWLQRHSGKLVILLPSGVTLYGGCTEAEIKNKYDLLTNAAGNGRSIVLGAELSPFPADKGWKYSQSEFDWAETRRTTTLSALGIADDWADTYAECANGPCGPSMKYQYAHSGFIMGPAEDVQNMIQGMKKYTGWADRYFSDYYLANPDKVTLDYGGVLALTLNNMNKTGAPPVGVLKTAGDASTAYLKRLSVPGGHAVTATPVCFVQGNGNGFGALKTMAESITETASR